MFFNMTIISNWVKCVTDSTKISTTSVIDGDSSHYSITRHIERPLFLAKHNAPPIALSRINTLNSAHFRVIVKLHSYCVSYLLTFSDSLDFRQWQTDRVDKCVLALAWCVCNLSSIVRNLSVILLSNVVLLFWKFSFLWHVNNNMLKFYEYVEF